MGYQIQWRTQNDGSAEEYTQSTALDCSKDPGFTVQSAMEDADINVLMKRFGVTGEMPAPEEAPYYGDFSQVTDYHSALNEIQAAQDAFMTLPAEMRARFDNDPGQLITFLEDPANGPEAIQLGILEAPATPTPPAGTTTPPAGT